MKQTVKRLLQAVAPQWTTALISARARADGHRVVKEWGCLALNDKLVSRLGRAANRSAPHGEFA